MWNLFIRFWITVFHLKLQILWYQRIKKKAHNENINKIGERIYGEQFLLRFV